METIFLISIGFIGGLLVAPKYWFALGKASGFINGLSLALKTLWFRKKKQESK